MEWKLGKKKNHVYPFACFSCQLSVDSELLHVWCSLG